jgi:uncharacterized protein
MSATASPSVGAPARGGAPPPTPAPASPPAPPSAAPTGPSLAIDRILATLSQMSEDLSLPRNIRRGAQGAREVLTKNGVAVDVRVAGAVGVLDDLANDSNIPVHGRTAIWSLISQLESLQ